MACRIGITTDPDRREKEWKREHPSLRNWKILGRSKNKSVAQKAETLLARKFGCDAAPGGPNDEDDIWYVYKFDY